MSLGRKLKADMDRCFKKISDGLIVFDGIWKKVYATSEHSQREKLSLELKKELKKLQVAQCICLSVSAYLSHDHFTIWT